MALTKISGSILKDPLNLGEVSIGGTLTYQDVTNVDSVGIITARAGINVTGGVITGNVTGNLTGTASTATTVTVADVSSDTSCSVLYTTAATGNLQPKSGSNLTFNSVTGALSATSFVGNLTGQASALGSSVFATTPVNNRIVTTTGGNDLNPEQFLTFDGAKLNITTNSAGFRITRNSQYLELDANSGNGGDQALATSAGFRVQTGGVGNSYERLRIKSDGNIGMGGNTNPTNVLHIKTAVTNTAVATIESTATNSYPFLRLKNDAREYQLTCHGGLSDAFTIYDGTSSAHRFTITSAGKVSIASGAYGGGGTVPELYVKGTSGRQMKIHNSNASTSSLQITNATTGEGEDAGTQLFTQGSTGDFYISNQFASGDISFNTRPSGGSNTKRFTIDSNGYVTKPHNAMFKAVRTTNQAVSSNGWHVIQFNSDSATGCFDVGNNFDTSNHRFTAPVTGYYQFGLNQRIDGGDNSYFRVALTVNDGGLNGQYPYGHAIYQDTDNFPYYTFSITSLIYLTAGQYVKANAYSHTDTTWYLQDESQFYGYLVG